MAEKKDEIKSERKIEQKFNWFPKFTYKRAQKLIGQIMSSDAVVREDLMKVFGIAANKQSYLYTVWHNREDAMKALNKLRYKVFHRLLLHPHDWIDFKLSFALVEVHTGTSTLPAKHRASIEQGRCWSKYAADPLNVYWNFAWGVYDGIGIQQTMPMLFKARSSLVLKSTINKLISTDNNAVEFCRWLIKHSSKRICFSCGQSLGEKKAWKCSQCRVAVFCSWDCFLHNPRNQHNVHCRAFHETALYDALVARENPEVD
jgi:hypothetical protein